MTQAELHAGKTALITGGASGIGAGIARRLAEEGCAVTVADLDDAAARALAAELPGEAEALTMDVSDEASVEAGFAHVLRSRGRLDIAVNNAGIIQIAPVVETDVADWRRLVDTNLTGVFLGSRAAARIMSEQGHGVIVNAASGAARRGVPMISGYCASKAAILIFSQSLAMELAPKGVRVNCYAPGHIQTPFWTTIAEGFSRVTGQSPEEVVEGFRTAVPMGRFGTPEDVAAAVSWLASDDAAYVSGETIAMNGAEFPY